MTDLLRLFKALADVERIKIIAALSDGPRTAEEIVAEAGLPRRSLTRHLAYLQSVGLVEEEDGRYRFDPAPLIAALQATSPPAEEIEAADADDRTILGNFLRGGRLTTIPAQAKKREVILRYLSDRFQAGRTYDEKEINAALAQVHDDVASLRRYLVDGGYLHREIERSTTADGELRLQTVYWKPEPVIVGQVEP